MIFLILFAISFVCVSFLITRKISKYLLLRKKLDGLPGPKCLPFIGIGWEIARLPAEDCFKWLNTLSYKFKDGIIVLWFGMTPAVVIRKPQHLQIIMSSNTNITKSERYRSLKDWLGEGLVTSKGTYWFNHRRMITPAFHFSVLEEYAAVMKEKVHILTEVIEKNLKENKNEPINIFEYAIKYTLDTVCETAMGVKLDSLRKSDIPYVKALHDFSSLSWERNVRFWLQFYPIFYFSKTRKDLIKAIETMQEFTEKVIVQKQEERKNCSESTARFEADELGKRKRKAFLDLLLDYADSLTPKELREEVDTFMFAGHDTTATAISWALFALGNEPEIQNNVHRELDEVFGNDESTASSQQLGQLKYLDRVMKEALRVYPSVPEVSRCLEEDVVIDNYIIPKDTMVEMNMYQLHHDPDVWEDPEKFDPDRFLPENMKSKHPFATVPFSAGPRNCIGQKFALLEIKTTLIAVLRKWRVRSVLKPAEIKFQANILLTPVGNKIELYFEPLKTESK